MMLQTVEEELAVVEKKLSESRLCRPLGSVCGSRTDFQISWTFRLGLRDELDRLLAGPSAWLWIR